MNLSIRSARVDDVKAIHSYLLSAASGGLLLARPLSQIYDHIRDFLVLVDKEDKVHGCCAVSIIWDDLAEIRSLYIEEDFRSLGLGRKLVEEGIRRARESLGIKNYFTLTYQTKFFSSLGFEVTDMEILPQKIWTDCFHCPKYPDACDEVAMIKKIN